MPTRPLLPAAAAALVALGLAAQLPPPPGKSQEPRTPAPQGQGPAAAPGGTRPEAPRPGDGEPKPYDKVITSEFQTHEGLFRVHSNKGKHYLEIPKAELGKEMLLVASIKGSPSRVGYPGQSAGNLTVRWELRDHKVLLRLCSHAALADPNREIALNVRAMETEEIMNAFPVEAFAKNGAPVIDATRYFSGDISELRVKEAVQGGGVDTNRSFIENVKVFPGNLNIESLLTYNGSPAPGAGAGPSRAPQARTTLVTYSMVKLPEVPMMARLADDRMGYFGFAVTDFGRNEHEAVKRGFISRWRLEKKDPQAERSEPIKPIVFYIDPATPAQWVPFIKRGVEAWQPAFEAAGFLKAIQAREAPSPKDDPDWSMDDARYSCIRWIPSTTANAMGPHVSDPRSGEILESKIEIYHNILQLATDWYFTQVAPLDARAQKLPLPDDLMGELVTYVVTHEVGHTLGLAHNFKASSAYTLAQIRDKNWVREHGHVSSLMDYSRFNYVAQPEDGIDVRDLIPKVGPYDALAIRWGYSMAPGAKTPDEEKPFLEAILEVQKARPELRFSNPRSEGSDPGDQSEAVGDIDAVKAGALGLKNLKRVLDLVPGATLKPGEDLDRMEHMYQAVFSQWSRELGHVVPLVGGWDNAPKWGTEAGVQFTPVPAPRQREAIQFLVANVFQTPTWILKGEYLQKLQPGTGQLELIGVQRSLLSNLLSPQRTTRLQEHEALLGSKAYTIGKLLADLRNGIFTELASGSRVDAFRRNLQRTYLEILANRLGSAPAPAAAPGGFGAPRMKINPSEDARGAILAELKVVQGLCGRGSADEPTRVHLADLKHQLSRFLDPKFVPGPSPSAFPNGGGR